MATRPPPPGRSPTPPRRPTRTPPRSRPTRAPRWPPVTAAPRRPGRHSSPRPPRRPRRTRPRPIGRPPARTRSPPTGHWPPTRPSTREPRTSAAPTSRATGPSPSTSRDAPTVRRAAPPSRRVRRAATPPRPVRAAAPASGAQDRDARLLRRAVRAARPVPAAGPEAAGRLLAVRPRAVRARRSAAACRSAPSPSSARSPSCWPSSLEGSSWRSRPASPSGVHPTIVAGAMLVTIGGGLLIAAWWGRGAGLVAAGHRGRDADRGGPDVGGLPWKVGASVWRPTSGGGGHQALRRGRGRRQARPVGAHGCEPGSKRDVQRLDLGGRADGDRAADGQGGGARHATRSGDIQVDQSLQGWRGRPVRQGARARRSTPKGERRHDRAEPEGRRGRHGGAAWRVISAGRAGRTGPTGWRC